MPATSREPSVLVCGEALFDVFPDPGGPVGSVWPMQARAGGSPFNVAIGLARLGRRTSFLGGLSTDPLGQALADRLEREGVDTALCPRLPGPTTLGVIAIGANGQPSYAFHGHGAADRNLVPAMLPASLEHVDAVHVGSYSLCVQPTGATLAALVRRAEGRLVTFDPNVRLAVEPDRAIWRAVLAGAGAAADVIKVSAEDLALLFPDRPPEASAEELLALGCGLVVMTDGAKGAAGWTPRSRVACAARPVGVVDTVGAGDSFMSALIDGLVGLGVSDRQAAAALAPERIDGLLTRCIAAAAITCGRQGADPPTLSDMEGALA